MEILVWFN